MAKIELEKYERDCGSNDSARAKGETRDLIRDFRVLIDGEYRAILSRIRYGGKGYEVRDPDHRPIQRKWGHWDRAEEISSQAKFMEVLHDLLACGHIPTLAEIEMDRLRDAAIRDNKKVDAHANNVKQAKIKHIEQLYEIVHTLRHADTPVLEQKLVERADAALLDIEAQISIWDKSDEDR